VKDKRRPRTGKVQAVKMKDDAQKLRKFAGLHCITSYKTVKLISTDVRTLYLRSLKLLMS